MPKLPNIRGEVPSCLVVEAIIDDLEKVKAGKEAMDSMEAGAVAGRAVAGRAVAGRGRLWV